MLVFGLLDISFKNFLALIWRVFGGLGWWMTPWLGITSPTHVEQVKANLELLLSGWGRWSNDLDCLLVIYKVLSIIVREHIRKLKKETFEKSLEKTSPRLKSAVLLMAFKWNSWVAHSASGNPEKSSTRSPEKEIIRLENMFLVKKSSWMFWSLYEYFE